MLLTHSPAWRPMLVIGLGACLFAGCAHGRSARSYLPVGASAQYGAHTNDGVTWMLARPVHEAMDDVGAVLREEGYLIDAESSKEAELRTEPLAVGGDTTLVVRAQFLAVELPAPATSIVLTATYSVPSRQIRNAPVLQRANTTNSLYTRLRAISSRSRRLEGR